MKRKLLELVAIIILIVTWVFICNTADSHTAGIITKRQALFQYAIEIVVLSIATEVVCSNFKDGEWT